MSQSQEVHDIHTPIALSFSTNAEPIPRRPPSPAASTVALSAPAHLNHFPDAQPYHNHGRTFTNFRHGEVHHELFRQPLLPLHQHLHRITPAVSPYPGSFSTPHTPLAYMTSLGLAEWQSLLSTDSPSVSSSQTYSQLAVHAHPDHQPNSMSRMADSPQDSGPLEHISWPTYDGIPADGTAHAPHSNYSVTEASPVIPAYRVEATTPTALTFENRSSDVGNINQEFEELEERRPLTGDSQVSRTSLDRNKMGPRLTQDQKRARNRQSSQRFRDRAKERAEEVKKRIQWLEDRVESLEAELRSLRQNQSQTHCAGEGMIASTSNISEVFSTHPREISHTSAAESLERLRQRLGIAEGVADGFGRKLAALDIGAILECAPADTSQSPLSATGNAIYETFTPSAGLGFHSSGMPIPSQPRTSSNPSIYSSRPRSASILSNNASSSSALSLQSLLDLDSTSNLSRNSSLGSLYSQTPCYHGRHGVSITEERHGQQANFYQGDAIAAGEQYETVIAALPMTVAVVPDATAQTPASRVGVAAPFVLSPPPARWLASPGAATKENHQWHPSPVGEAGGVRNTPTHMEESRTLAALDGGEEPFTISSK